MSQDSFFWTTDDTGDGAASGYTQTEYSRAFEALAACSGFEGVAPGYLNELECTANGAETVAVNTGGALVDGKTYYNSASVDVNVPAASGAGNTRIDRIVLRASWAAQTVRITRIAGIDAASPSAPAITQTSGTTYDIQLCQVLVDTGGTVTVADERTWAQGDDNSLSTGAVTTVKLAARAVTSAKLQTAAVATVKLATGAVTSAKIASGAVVETKLASSAVSAVKIADSAVTSAKVANGAIVSDKLSADAVTGTAAGNRIIQLHRRQGGSATNWFTYGTTNYTPTTVRGQVGHKRIYIGTGLVTGTTHVTFPVAFSYAPLVYLTAEDPNPGQGVFASLDSVTATRAGLRVTVSHTFGGITSWSVQWLAIGPE